MELLVTFLLAFCFSFVGSIPPGTLNISALQLGLSGNLSAATRFAIAAAVVEYPYAWLAVEFEDVITSETLVGDNIQVVAGLTMVVLGVLNLWTARKPVAAFKSFQKSGFRRGILLSILNPMALPFWIGVTAYLRGLRWIKLSSVVHVHAYLLGVSIGAFCLLMTVALLAKHLFNQLNGHPVFEKVPGILLIVLGGYAIVQNFYL